MLDEEFIEDLDIDREPTVYEIGDQVVYPHHGAGKVLKKDLRAPYWADQERAVN